VSTLVIAIGLSLVGGLGGLFIAAAFLLFDPATRSRLVPSLVSYAVGAMLGVSLLAILPEALRMVPAEEAPRLLGTLLGGILLFFVLEKFVLWHHTHDHDHHHEDASPLVLIGDSVHNFVDGAMIAAAVMTSVPLGISTAIAVAAHEIPHEVGDFAILLHAGYSPARALLLNVLSGLAGALGALFAVLLFDALPPLVPYALTIAAASFLYIAMADLIPGLHRVRPVAGSFRQIVLVGLGIATVLIV
jgi:zinc and cadmium transporter